MLSRYRGLVQNIYDPEFYCGEYAVNKADDINKNSHYYLGKYRDDINIRDDNYIDREERENVDFSRTQER